MSYTRAYHLPDTLLGYENIFRFYDPAQKKVLAKILPGEYYISRSPEEIITTTLGSCISVCARDVELGLGGMNHFMLPGESEKREDHLSPQSPSNRYGVFAIENLINAILKLGGARQRLEIKVTGGGRIHGGRGSVGDTNVQFIRHFLKVEGLHPVSSDLGGEHPRKVRYNPISGQLQVKKLRVLRVEKLVEQEEQYRASITQVPIEGSIELF